MRILTDARFVISLALAAIAGAAGLHAWPWPIDNPILGLVYERRPILSAGLQYAYATLWFTTSLIVFNVVLSVAYIFVTRLGRGIAYAALPPYPEPEHRRDLCLVLGEQHHRTLPVRSAEPRWLVIPERGLYTGILVVGAIGTGKSSACMYPYVEQLLAYRAEDAARKMSGLVLEVKGDFCHRVREILRQHGRAADYVEVSLESGFRYNPLYNQLDAYALAYGIATLMTNLFGHGKEPFWQQASTNLVKFVILLHQTLDDYVTLFQVYACVINPDRLRDKIAEGDRRFEAQNRRIAVDKLVHGHSNALEPWNWLDEDNGAETWTHWTKDIENSLKAGQIRLPVLKKSF